MIRNYVSSISFQCSLYQIPCDCHHPAIARFLHSISMTSHFRPTLRGVFDVQTLYHISGVCDLLSDPILFRAIFLTAFYGFLRMSNIAPQSARAFDPFKHFLGRTFSLPPPPPPPPPPRAHLLLKWTKTLQDQRAHHVTILFPLLCQ